MRTCLAAAAAAVVVGVVVLIECVCVCVRERERERERSWMVARVCLSGREISCLDRYILKFCSLSSHVPIRVLLFSLSYL